MITNELLAGHGCEAITVTKTQSPEDSLNLVGGRTLKPEEGVHNVLEGISEDA